MSSRRGILLVVLLILVGVVVSVGAVILTALFTPTAAPVPQNSTLYLPIEAPYPEAEPSDLLSAFGAPRVTLRNLIASLRRAKTDGRIRNLVVIPKSGGLLWAQGQEIRAAIEDFRTSGKQITAFIEAAGGLEYYIATAADRVVLMPAGQIDLVGVATHELFLRGTLDKIGVYPDLLHIGDYKTASNMFTEKSFTPAHREMTTSMNRDWYDQLVGAVAQGRKRSAAEAKLMVDNGPYLGEEAVRAGLVDALAYEDWLDDEPPIRGTRRLDAKNYVRSGSTTTFGDNNRIALIYAVGTITSGESSSDAWGSTVVGSDSFVGWIRRARIDPNTRAVVIRIDSPGGSAVASEVMWREIKLTRDVKPVIVSMGDVAASGGYYIAAPAHVIVAQPGTITGSIGVVTGKMVLDGTLDKLGVNTESVADGPNALIYSPFRRFTDPERQRVAAQMKFVYDTFLQRVAEGRSMPPEKVHEVAQGRVWTGAQAKARGLVDEIGGLEVALRLAKERAKLDPRREYPLTVYPPRRSLFELLANPFGTSVGSAAQKVGLPVELTLLQRAAATLGHFRRGETLVLLPNIFWRN